MPFYWYEGKKIELKHATTRRAVRCSGKITPQGRQRIAAALNVAEPAAGAELELSAGIVLYRTKARSQAQAAQPLAPGALPEEARELTVFESDSGEPIILTEEFNAQFKAEVTRQQIDEFNAQNKVRVIRKSSWEANAFLLAVQEDAGTDALTMANRYHESALTLYAEPNFLQMLQPDYIPDDPRFSQQWALKNTGQLGGIAGEDIRAVDAWEVTQGSPNIIIAVLDEGVDYAHPDLNTPGKLVTGYDAQLLRDDPTPLDTRDSHGTACAGIAAGAANNGIGVSGVAPHCRIMGVRIAHGEDAIDPITGAITRRWDSTNDQAAAGIMTAANRGADVLSNSWSGPFPSTEITNAIHHAKNTGRGGRGCVVCFSAGNFRATDVDRSVRHPSISPEVIAVAASNPWGEHKNLTSRDGEPWGSRFGPEVDLCAPGVFVHTTTNGNNYTDSFNGTSAAAPHVAGVAALLLSVNPDLTATEVEQILYRTADHIGAPSRDHFTGHGRVNAHRALQELRTLSNRIYVGNSLAPGQALDSSPDRRFTLFMRRGGADGGNLEIVGPGGLRQWASSSQGNAGASAHFLADGNFVVRSGANTLWETRTAGSGAAYGQLEESGHFTLYTAADEAVWSTQTMLSVGVRLELPRELVSLDNTTRLSLQADGNLALSVGGTVLWSSARAGNPAAYAELQEDGNFVVRSGFRTLWETQTADSGAVFVQLEDAAFTLRTRGGHEVWSTYRLNLGRRLTAGQNLLARNGQYTLNMEADGVLAFRNAAGRLLWASPTAGNPGAYAELSSDGNLLVRSGQQTLWETRTAGSGAVFAQLEDEGYFTLRTREGTVVWSSRGMLTVGVRLHANEELISPNGQFRLRMQPSGSLELLPIGDDTILWTTFTLGHTGGYAELLPDGNLIITNGIRGIWTSVTANSPTTFVQVQDVGNFALYATDGTLVRQIP